jgi:23S rRNA G2069 N7-methylase RlmK/C1962 C5-methylase RlmI
MLVAPPRSFHRRDDQAGWDARPEYLQLLGRLLPHLVPSGKIYFVTSVRRFRLDAGDLPGATIREISRQTTPADFRAKPPHRSWSIVRT